MDDGSFSNIGKGTYSLSTHCFSHQDNILICDVLKKKFILMEN